LENFKSELISEAMNYSEQLGMTPWMVD